MGHYTRTATAYETLIWAEVSARMVLEAARQLKSSMQMLDKVHERFSYVWPEEPTDDPELRALTRRRRAEVPGHFRGIQDAADRYFEQEAEFRSDAEDAKRKIDLAAIELDSQETPPLRRDSIAIKRALGQLSASVPYRISAPWAAATEQEVQDRIATALFEVRRWIQELRLLVQPEHLLPPPEGTRSRATARNPKRRLPVGSPRLHERQWRILGVLFDSHAIDAASSMKRPTLATRTTHQKQISFVAKHVAGLKRRKLVDSRVGRKGGVWITRKGIETLHTRRAELDQTGPN